MMLSDFPRGKIPIQFKFSQLGFYFVSSYVRGLNTYANAYAYMAMGEHEHDFKTLDILVGTIATISYNQLDEQHTKESTLYFDLCTLPWSLGP